jgi:hypothetical protein
LIHSGSIVFDTRGIAQGKVGAAWDGGSMRIQVLDRLVESLKHFTSRIKKS